MTREDMQAMLDAGVETVNERRARDRVWETHLDERTRHASSGTTLVMPPLDVEQGDDCSYYIFNVKMRCYGTPEGDS